jgi:FkbH-like domain
LLDHFSCFKANWEPKHENIKAIASELNIGLDSIVFVDDNPAEREIISAQLPAVAVPDVGSDVSGFIRVLEDGRYFEPVRLSSEDLKRAEQYQENAQRAAFQGRFQDYGEYLESLEMSAEVAAFKPVYLDRITQLIGKTNQFNLTTRRYTRAQVEAIAADPSYISLYGKLTDKFGDNGLISVIIGRKENHILHIDLWIMSCRVLKRGMESVMLDALVAECQSQGIGEIRGYYIQRREMGWLPATTRRLALSQAGVMTSIRYSSWISPRATSSRISILRSTCMSDILAELQPIFRDVLDDPALQITRQSSAATVANWDSLAHINLVSAIEQEFHIRFSLSELAELKNVGDMIDLMEQKLAAK